MARSRRGLERTNVRDSPPAAASRKIHRRHVIERNVTKKFVCTKRQTPILGCGRTHRECRPPVLHTRVTSLKELSEPVDPFPDTDAPFPSRWGSFSQKGSGFEVRTQQLNCRVVINCPSNRNILRGSVVALLRSQAVSTQDSRLRVQSVSCTQPPKEETVWG